MKKIITMTIFLWFICGVKIAYSSSEQENKPNTSNNASKEQPKDKKSVKNKNPILSQGKRRGQ